MKDFLYSKFERILGIAAGVQVVPLNRAVVEILDALPSSRTPNRKRIPLFVEMTLAIEEQLHLLKTDAFSSLREYLDQKPQRISSFSDALASCFIRYGLYGIDFLEKWLGGHGWQQMVWKSLFSEESPWTYPLKFLKVPLPENFPQGKIALFGFSYLSPAHLQFFSAFNAELYQLSPSAFFWGDSVSDKQRVFASRKGASQAVVQSMQQGHPLLGNWGKLGREHLKGLDLFLLDERDTYTEEFPQTLLGQIKASLLTLESISFQSDRSIQLHSATSRLREVEILRTSVETLLQEHLLKEDPIFPREIVVASPDISGYAPYISMVFSESGLP